MTCWLDGPFILFLVEKKDGILSNGKNTSALKNKRCSKWGISLRRDEVVSYQAWLNWDRCDHAHRLFFSALLGIRFCIRLYTLHLKGLNAKHRLSRRRWALFWKTVCKQRRIQRATGLQSSIPKSTESVYAVSPMRSYLRNQWQFSNSYTADGLRTGGSGIWINSEQTGVLPEGWVVSASWRFRFRGFCCKEIMVVKP